MAESRNSTTNQVLESHKSVVKWTTVLSNLFAFLLVIGCFLLWQMQAYAGGWEQLFQTKFTAVNLWIPAWDPFSIQLQLTAQGLEPLQKDVTEPAALFLAAWVVFRLLQGTVRFIAGIVWRSRMKRHMRRLTELAQEVRRRSESPRVDDLQDAIHHMSPTQPTRLHTGDPDLRGLEAAINDLLDRMQAAYSQQTRFVSDASHELRTPIAVLKGYADLLERWGKDDPQVRDESIAAIQNETQRMSRLVEQLLFLARGDSGRTQLKKEHLDLSALLREIWEESEMIDPDHRWILDAAPVYAIGDRDMLKQAVRILADNAAKYTPYGKEILLRTYEDDRGRPCLSVRDEGIGIKSGDASHVFERFFRSDPARSRQSGGAGLGLSIADWIVTGHGGHMEVYSWEEVGTKFTIILPPVVE